MSKKIKLSSITPDDKNNNKHTAYGMDLLEKSVNKVGIIESITVSNDDKIISGNARHEVIGKNFEKEALVIETDGTQPIIIKRTDIESDTKQFYEASILANTTAKKNIDFDMEVIDILVEEFDIDVVDLGLDIIEDEVLEAEEDDFNGTPPKEPITVLGDLYEIGEHRLLCGDSTDSDQVAKLMNGEKADMVFTDPPFPNNSEIMHDMIKNIDGAFNNSRLFCDKLMIWFWDNLEFPPFLEQVTSKHIWHKTNGWQAGHFETMYCYHNDKKRHEQKVYSVNNVGGDNNREEQGNHPTPKPISLIFEIINDLSKNSKLILDLFLGSGSTMVASHQLKRKCYGMELDCKYCDVIVARMIKLDSTLLIKRNGTLLTKSELDKFTANTSDK